MTLADYAVAATVLFYGAAAIDYARQGNLPFGFVFLCYALANAALAWAAHR